MDPLSQTPAQPTGDQFEEFFWGLLRRKYPQGDLVYFPAAIRGDKGLEGYSADGIGYQCYVDRDSVTLRHRTDKQKSKLTTDTSKLQTNAAELKKLLHGVVLRHYFLVVPQYHATELVAHANMRADKVRKLGLSFIHPDFEIRVKTPEDYPQELQAALSDGSGTLSLPPALVEPDAVTSFPAQQTGLTATLNTKLQHLQAANQGADVTQLRDRFIRWYLVKEELKTALQAWPETFESLERQRQAYEDRLEFENAFATEAPARRLSSIVETYSERLSNDVAGLDVATAQTIARGQAGEWLMRCPIDFEETV